ncbi:UNVERIFIED_CONTAM: hypothetical protein HDU68_001153 [Siphonaria sp. JEL0065]|nr:hypothetical protein HDU68_001153 [Siphonaria sp. JEL0065]
MSPNSYADTAELNGLLLAEIKEKLMKDSAVTALQPGSRILTKDEFETLYKSLEFKFAQKFGVIKKELSRVELSKFLNPYVESKRPVMKFSGREWFLEKVQTWWNSNLSQVFWLQGEAGSGKSTMMDIVMHHFNSSSLLPKAVGFYFNYKAELDSDRFVKTLAFELALVNSSVNAAIQRHSDSLFGISVQGPSAPSVFDIFKAVIVEPLGNDKLLICIDALDECEPMKRRPLLELLGSSQLPKNIRFFVTSRLGDSDLYDYLADSEHCTFTANPTDNRKDLIIHARSRMHGLKFLDKHPKLSEWENQIVDMCNGSFLTLVVAFETINPKNETRIGPKKPKSSMDFQKRFEKMIESDPSIENLYRSVLTRVVSTSENSFANSVLELIVFLLCLKEPLDAESIAYFLEVDPDAGQDGGKIEFKHKTVYEFLTTDVKVLGSFDLELANEKIGKKCVELVTRLSLGKDDEFLYRVFTNAVAPPEFVLEDVPTSVVKYAISHWVRHFEGMLVSKLDMSPLLQLYPVSCLLVAFEFNIDWLVHEILTLKDGIWGEIVLLNADCIRHTFSKSPLIYSAAKSGNPVMCLHLLKVGNADTRSRGWTPRQYYGEHSQCVMHEAIKSKSLETVKILLQFTKDVGVLLLKDDYGWTPLDYALGEIADYCRIFRRQREFEAGVGKMDPFFVVVWENRVDLSLTHDYQMRNDVDRNRTALHYACEKGHSNLVAFLLAQNGVSTDSRDDQGWTPLHCASENSHETIAGLLLDAGVAVDQLTTAGATALHFACARGNISLVSRLISAGAILNSVTSSTTTSEYASPLHVAARYGHLALTRWLVEKGASMTARDNKLYTPMHLAASYGHSDIVDYLLDQNVDLEPLNIYNFNPLHSAVDNDCLEATRLLIKRGAAMNVPDVDGRTPLLAACSGGYRQVTSLLLSKGVNIYASEKNGKTALHVAAEKGCKEIVRELLQHSANANAKSLCGWTPILSAIEHNQLDIVELLLPVSDLNCLSEIQGVYFTSRFYIR